jgi:hypothetical protein
MPIVDTANPSTVYLLIKGHLPINGHLLINGHVQRGVEK